VIQNKVKLLIVDDDEDDIVLIKDIITDRMGSSIDVSCARSASEAMANFDRVLYDVCFLDYKLGEDNGLKLLHEIKVKGIDTSIILLTGQGNEDIAVDALKNGAVDYIRKSKLSSDIICSTIKYTLELRKNEEERKRLDKERDELISKLKETLSNQTPSLSGLIPICAKCKKIRDDKGFWTAVECYIKERSGADFTHSICPDCKTDLYPELY